MKNDFKELLGQTIEKMYLSNDNDVLLIKTLEDPQFLKYKIVLANDYSMTWIKDININNASGIIKEVNVSDWKSIPQQAWDETCKINLKMETGDIQIVVINSLNPNQSSEYGNIEKENLNDTDLNNLPNLVNEMKLVFNAQEKKVKKLKF